MNKSLVLKLFLTCSVVLVWSVCLSCCVFQRSVTSVCRCRVTRTVMNAVWTVRAPSPVCVKLDGGVSAVSRVRWPTHDMITFIFTRQQRESYITLFDSQHALIQDVLFHSCKVASLGRDSVSSSQFLSDELKLHIEHLWIIYALIPFMLIKFIN